MTLADAPIENTVRIMDIVREAMQQFDEPTKAAAWFKDHVRSMEDGEDKDFLIDLALYECGLHRIHDLRHDNIQAIKDNTSARSNMPPIANINPMAGHAGRAAMKTVAVSILRGWFVGNKPLGKCTGAELLLEADRERRIAHGHMTNELFYRRIADEVGKTDPVELRLTEQQANEFLQQSINQMMGRGKTPDVMHDPNECFSRNGVKPKESAKPKGTSKPPKRAA